MINEIINDLQRIADRKCYPEDILDGSIAQEWIDYITDLQQENKYKKILTELEEWLKKEIERTNDFIQEEPYLSQINNIRKMSNDVRYGTLSKIQELKEKVLKNVRE